MLEGILKSILIGLLAVLAPLQSVAAGDACRDYRDSRGVSVRLHPRSFVDRSVCPGRADCLEPVFSIPGKDNRPDDATGPPSFRFGERRKGKPSKIYSLGCKGSATWEFVDNNIVDVAGPDLMVFEVGRASEATRVEISTDGLRWLDVGTVEGRRSSIDLAGKLEKDLVYRFIRLTDLGTSCGNATAGADIDTIATYGFSWTIVEDESAVVWFEFARAELTERAKATLDRHFPAGSALEAHFIRIVGHTDSIGSLEDNLQLSVQRADAVRRHLVLRQLLPEERVSVQGQGEAVPVATNETPQGRSQNRRVEITVVPMQPCESRADLPSASPK